MSARNEGIYPIWYFGAPQDTMDVLLPGYFYFAEDTPVPAECVNRNRSDFRKPKGGDLSIHIYPYDTTETNDAVLGYGQDSMVFLRTIPIVVINHSKDTLCIGAENSIGLQLQAQDKDGHWQSVESVNQRFLNDPSAQLVLPGKQIAATGYMIYSGTFTTRLRFRLGSVCSATFSGAVNPKAFGIY